MINTIENIEMLNDLKNLYLTNNIKGIYQQYTLIFNKIIINKRNMYDISVDEIIYNFIPIFDNKLPLFIPLYFKEDDLYININYGNKEKIKLIKLNKYYENFIHNEINNNNQFKNIKCSNCNKYKIEYYCNDCCKNLCIKCIKNHLKHKSEKIISLNDNIIKNIIDNLINGFIDVKYINDFIENYEINENIKNKFIKFKEQIEIQFILFLILFFIYFDYKSENLLNYEIINNIKLFYKIDKNHMIKKFIFKDINNINENIELINSYIDDPNNFFLKVYKISSNKNYNIKDINYNFLILYKNLSNILISYIKFEIYEGEIQNGIKFGKGKLITNNFIYEGNFKEDKMCGFGTFLNYNGNIYEGYFNENKFNGKGMIIFTNGDFFYGNFIDNNMFGKGIYFFSDNHKIIEFWENNNIYSSTEKIDINLIQKFFDEENKNNFNIQNELNNSNIISTTDNNINNNKKIEKIKLKKPKNNDFILNYENFIFKNNINLNNKYINNIEIEYLSHRCEKCFLLLKFNNLFFYKNKIYIRYICDNQHEGIDTIENIYKKTSNYSLNYILCSICKKSVFDNNTISFYLCTIENKIYCSDHLFYCLNHLDKLININDIDFYCKNYINKNIFYCENCEENFCDNNEQLIKHINHKCLIIENEYVKINLEEIERNIKKNIEIYNKNIKSIHNFLIQMKEKINTIIYTKIEILFKNYINNNLLSLRFCIESYLLYKIKFKEKNNINYNIIFNLKNFCLNINLIEFNIINYEDNIEEIVLNLIEFLTNYNNYLFKNIVNFEDNLNKYLIKNYKFEKNNSLNKKLKLIKNENFIIFGEVLKKIGLFDGYKIEIDIKTGIYKEYYNNNEINNNLINNNNVKYFRSSNNIYYFSIYKYIIEPISNEYFSLNTETTKNEIRLYNLNYNGKYNNGMWNGEGTLKLNNNKIIYEGEFKNSLFHGKGKYFFHNGDIFEGRFLNNNLYRGISKFKNGYIYIGKLLDNKFSDLGILRNYKRNYEIKTMFDNGIPGYYQIIKQNELKIYINKDYICIYKNEKIKYEGEYNYNKKRINGFGMIFFYDEKKEIKEIFEGNFENNLFREGRGFILKKDYSSKDTIISNKIISYYNLEYETLIENYDESFESYVPRCKKCFLIPNIKIELIDEKLTIFTFCSGHNNKDNEKKFLIYNEFFNFNIHKCSICKEKNRKENRLYYCHTCKKFICENDIINCMIEMHKILMNINYFGFICLEHNKFFNFYCCTCYKNYCEKCDFNECKEKHNFINLNQYIFDLSYIKNIKKAINISKKNNKKDTKNIINNIINDKYSIILFEKLNLLLNLFIRYKITNYEIISFFNSYFNFNIKKLPNNSNINDINNIKYKLLIIKNNFPYNSKHKKNNKPIFVNNNNYQGYLYKNKKEGFGKIKDENGDIYEGEFFNDKKDGFGIYYYNNGDMYVGQFIDDQRGQYGILYYENDEYFEGGFLNNEKFFGIEILNHEIYQGKFVDNKRDGFGVLIKNNIEYQVLYYKGNIIEKNII